MTSKRVTIFAGTMLGGALLLGTAGLAVAQDSATSPVPSATAGWVGGMMGGQSVQGMMSGLGTSGGMMGGQSVQGMMSGMDAGHIAAMHRAMGQNGICSPTLMKALRDKSAGRGS